jgi:hypothetical protein
LAWPAIPSLKGGEEMATFRNSVFKGQTVDLDGNTYVECVFTNCVIRFSGGGPVSLVGCTFSECKFALDGAAAHTLRYLRAIYHGLGEWGKESVEKLFEEIRDARTKVPGDEK